MHQHWLRLLAERFGVEPILNPKPNVQIGSGPNLTTTSRIITDDHLKEAPTLAIQGASKTDPQAQPPKTKVSYIKEFEKDVDAKLLSKWLSGTLTNGMEPLASSIFTNSSLKYGEANTETENFVTKRKRMEEDDEEHISRKRLTVPKSSQSKQRVSEPREIPQIWSSSKALEGPITVHKPRQKNKPIAPKPDNVYKKSENSPAHSHLRITNSHLRITSDASNKNANRSRSRSRATVEEDSDVETAPHRAAKPLGSVKRGRKEKSGVSTNTAKSGVVHRNLDEVSDHSSDDDMVDFSQTSTSTIAKNLTTESLLVEEPQDSDAIYGFQLFVASVEFEKVDMHNSTKMALLGLHLVDKWRDFTFEQRKQYEDQANEINSRNKLRWKHERGLSQ